MFLLPNGSALSCERADRDVHHDARRQTARAAGERSEPQRRGHETLLALGSCSALLGGLLAELRTSDLGNLSKSMSLNRVDEDNETNEDD